VSATCRVYVNAHGVDAPQGATALEAVRLWSPDAAMAIESGSSALVDSRGLPADPSSRVHGGAIFRVISARRGSAAREGAESPPT
jgi:hypothetical protein